LTNAKGLAGIIAGGNTMAKTIGKIHDAKSLFLRVAVGKAKDPQTKIEYELTTNAGNAAPMICSGKTGKYFLLSWQNIIDLAIKAGIDK
jgi:hypothetical protein